MRTRSGTDGHQQSNNHNQRSAHPENPNLTYFTQFPNATAAAAAAPLYPKHTRAETTWEREKENKRRGKGKAGEEICGERDRELQQEERKRRRCAGQRVAIIARRVTAAVQLAAPHRQIVVRGGSCHHRHCRPVPGAISRASVTRGGVRPTAQSYGAVCCRRHLELMPPSRFEEREGGCGEDKVRWWWFVLPPLLPSPSRTAATKESERQRFHGRGRARRRCAMEQSEPRRRCWGSHHHRKKVQAAAGVAVGGERCASVFLATGSGYVASRITAGAPD
ncbi:uncharacterized protein LOC127743042 [Arachis duranensis]|uniref:Uncharacterized protein LOC127743042 n=1 Tax=Arachis duranensis TaxID=130453 RepID=A0A9C6TNM9_ARADU|nr:uncharacterized protein LOC127743042 [Arachis duranensis]